MSKTDGPQTAGWLERAWDKFHAWVLKNPGFYVGLAVGIAVRSVI